jgi:hypothetical protein
VPGLGRPGEFVVVPVPALHSHAAGRVVAGVGAVLPAVAGPADAPLRRGVAFTVAATVVVASLYSNSKQTFFFVNLDS